MRREADHFVNFALGLGAEAHDKRAGSGSIYVAVLAADTCRTYRFADHAPRHNGHDYSVFVGPRPAAQGELCLVPSGFDGSLRQAQTDLRQWLFALGVR